MPKQKTKQKKVRFYTDRLPCKYPRLTKPDTQFKAEGEYSVFLVATPEQAEAFLLKIKPEVEAQVAELRKTKEFAKWKPVFKIKDDTEGEDKTPTGNKLIKFEQTARVERDNDEPIVFTVSGVDAHGTKLDEKQMKSLRLGSGSELKLCFTVRVVPNKLQSNFSVKCHPSAFQLCKLVEYAAADGSDGFGEEEGYEVPTGTDEAGEPVAAGADGESPDF